MNTYLRKPEWLRISLNSSANTAAVRNDLREKKLHTVCEEARCPNLHECWSHHRTATFMVLGDTCTRRCRFCAVKTGKPDAPDPDEPQRIAASVRRLGIAHAVITMVDRDDLPDGGALHLAETGRAIRAENPETRIEYLSSDLMGKRESIQILVDSKPDILGHNVETVRRLTPLVRSRSSYQRSLEFLESIRKMNKSILIKSSIMLGLGESREEVHETLTDIRGSGCHMVNIGQYLQPDRQHIPVKRYWSPEEFDELAESAREMGFISVEAGPLVRSSYHAGDQLKSLLT